MKARTGALFLAQLALLIWPPSTIAQQLRHTPATVNLGPTSSTANGKLTHRPFAAPDGTAALLRNAGATRPMKIERSLTRVAADRFQVAHLPPAESEHSQRFPALYQEDTPFATQARMPLTDLWRGRLQFDGFYREISADSVIRGVPQSSGVWWASPQSLTLRSATSYGIQLSFRMPHIRPRTLYRYLLGRGG